MTDPPRPSEKPTDGPATFERDGQRYEPVPCMNFACRRPHDFLRTGPTMASFHRVEDND